MHCDYFNERWLAFTGRTLEQEEGDGWAQGVHPADFERCLTIYRKAFTRREIFEVEYRLRRYDGVYRWVLDRGVPFNGADREFGGYIGSCIDITDRVEAQATLRKAQRAELVQLRQLLPICSHCRQVRDDDGYWGQLESYLHRHSHLKFSHGLCPSCLGEFFPAEAAEEIEDADGGWVSGVSQGAAHPTGA